MSDLYCERCNTELETDDDYVTLKDGTVLCQYCFDEEYTECDECGEITPIDDLLFWGEIRICPNCMEGHCPSFDEEENEEETTFAYEDMKERYCGRRVIDLDPGDHYFTYEKDDWGEVIRYEISVTIGNDNRIKDISRLIAQMLLAESERSSEWAPYRIDEDDYEYIVDKIFEDEFMLDEQDEEEE